MAALVFDLTEGGRAAAFLRMPLAEITDARIPLTRANFPIADRSAGVMVRS